MPKVSPTPKAERVPLCSVPYEPAWPRRTRRLWIASVASWLRTSIPLVQQSRTDRGYDARLAERELCDAIQQTRELWTAALRELPDAVTRPLNALRDGLRKGDACPALLADLIVVEDEALRIVDAPADPGKGNRKGRLSKADSEAKRVAMLALLVDSPALRNDPAKLGESVKVSERTARRWLAREREKYETAMRKE